MKPKSYITLTLNIWPPFRWKQIRRYSDVVGTIIYFGPIQYVHINRPTPTKGEE